MVSSTASDQVHGTAVAIDGKGVLLLGDPGQGKSDVALRLIDRGARLIADDRVDLVRWHDHIVMNPPKRLAGLMEVRGLGIFRLEPALDIPLALAVHLVGREFIERLPDPATQAFLAIRVPHVRVDPFEPVAPIKIEWALAHARAAAEAPL